MLQRLDGLIKKYSFLSSKSALLAIVTGLLVVTSIFAPARKPARTHDWQEAEAKAENAVVQVIAQHARFNWLEPYKAPKLKEGAGTAFFINKDGYLLTNFHVVDQAKSLHVYIPALGQKPVDAEIVGVCPETDVALIKLTDESLKNVRSTLKKISSITLGDSDLLFPTEPVLALGFPLGQRYLKSTVGVIAGREYIDNHSFMHITAPINPGSSGGPLLNLDGQVVGITSGGIPSAQNIGFIIPMYDVQILLKDLKSQKLVRKPNPGLRYNPTTDEHAKLLNNPLPAGVYINNVELGSIAGLAGINAGDMLYAINGHPIDSYGDVTVNWPSSVKVSLEEFLIRLPSKIQLELVIWRGGRKKIVRSSYDAPKPQPIRYIYPDFEMKEVDYEVIGGMCIMQLRLNHLDFFDRIIPLQEYRLLDNQHKEALIITKILPGSVVHRINCFYEGAVLVNVNGKPVKSLADVRRVIKESVHTGIISLKSKDKIATAVSVDAVLKDEERISRDFKFSSTQAIKELIKSKKSYESKLLKQSTPSKSNERIFKKK